MKSTNTNPPSNIEKKLNEFIQITEQLINNFSKDNSQIESAIQDKINFLAKNHETLMRKYNKSKEVLLIEDVALLRKKYPFLLKKLSNLNEKLLYLTIHNSWLNRPNAREEKKC